MRIEIAVELCARCIRDTEATTKKTFCLDPDAGSWYEMHLCEKHSDMFERDLSAWTCYAELVDQPTHSRPPRTFTAHSIERDRRAAALRAATDEAKRHTQTQVRAAQRAAEIDAQLAHEQHHRDELAAKRAADAERAYEQRLAKSIPGAAKWRISKHARERMEQRGFDLETLLRTAAHPDNVFRQPWRGEYQAVHQSGSCRAVVDEMSHTVITVMDPSAPLETETEYREQHQQHTPTFAGPERKAQ